MAFVRELHGLSSLAARGGVVLLFLGSITGCQLSSDPPRARIEAALPSLLDEVAQVTVYGSVTETGFEPSAEEALRIAMASCVRFYCPPDSVPSFERAPAHNPAPTTPSSRSVMLEFRSPQDVPTALPLPGWFGPLRGREKMAQVERLGIILEQGQWAEVIARQADGGWSCWKSNWAFDLSHSEPR